MKIQLIARLSVFRGLQHVLRIKVLCSLKLLLIHSLICARTHIHTNAVEDDLKSKFTLVTYRQIRQNSEFNVFCASCQIHKIKDFKNSS